MTSYSQMTEIDQIIGETAAIIGSTWNRYGVLGRYMNHERHIRCYILNIMSAGNADSVIRRGVVSCLCDVAVPAVNTKGTKFFYVSPCRVTARSCTGYLEG